MASISDSNYTPSWYVEFDMTSFQGAVDGRYYYKQGNSFPTIINQAEWDGIASGTYYAYDDEIWWGNQIFNTGNCVASALSVCMQILTYLATGVKERFSVVWLHGNQSGGLVSSTKSNEPVSNSYPVIISPTPVPGTPGPTPVPTSSSDDGGKGANTTDELNHLRDDGAVPYSKIYPYMCRYSNLQYDTDPAGTGMTALSFVQNNRSALLPQANKYRISSWQSMGQYDIAGIKQAILDYGCVIVNLTKDEDFNHVGDDGIIPDIYPTLTIGHDVTVIGWATIDGREYWKIINTWGNWGVLQSSGNRNGTAYLSFSHSKIYSFYKIIPNINPTVDWDTPKVAGELVVINGLEWSRMMQRLKYKLAQRGINWIPYTSYRHLYFYAYQYNSAISILNSTLGTQYPSAISRHLIAATQMNSVRDAINAM